VRLSPWNMSFVVWEKRPGWLRIELAGGTTPWLQEVADGRYVSVRQFLSGDFLHFEAFWDRKLFATPGGAATRWKGDDGNVRGKQHRIVAGKRWVRVEMMQGDLCPEDAGSPRVVLARGWVRASMLGVWNLGCD
jgi:hypothetical protein